MDHLHPGDQLDPDEEDGLGGEPAPAQVEEVLWADGWGQGPASRFGPRSSSTIEL